MADRRRARRHPPRDDRSGRVVHLRDARRSRHPRRPRHLATADRPARGAAQRVLDRLPPDARFGRTFSTEFTWDVAGDRLAVQSCGELACRIRVIAPGGGPVVTLDSPDLGTIVGLDGDRAVTYEACRGLPCPIVSTDLAHRRSPSCSPTRPGWPSSSRARRVRGSSTRPAADRAAGCVPSPLDGEGAARSRDRPRRSSPPAVRDPRRRGHRPARRAGSCSLPMAAFRSIPATARPQLRHVPDGSTVPLDEALR